MIRVLEAVEEGNESSARQAAQACPVEARAGGVARSLRAADLFAVGSLVLHAPTGIVGRVRTVWEAGEYLHAPAFKGELCHPDDPEPKVIAAVPCPYPVIELSTGNRFILRPGSGALRSLTEGEARCYAEVLLPLMLAAARSAKNLSEGRDVFDPGVGLFKAEGGVGSVGALFMAAARAALIEAWNKLPGAEP